MLKSCHMFLSVPRAGIESCVVWRRQKFPLFFSQDGTPVHTGTQEVAQSYEQVCLQPNPVSCHHVMADVCYLPSWINLLECKHVWAASV